MDGNSYVIFQYATGCEYKYLKGTRWVYLGRKNDPFYAILDDFYFNVVLML